MAANLKDRKPTKSNVVAIDPKHNQKAAQEKRDARRNALRRYLHKLSEHNTACDLTAAAHKENTDARTETYRMIKAELGLTRAQADAYYRDMRANSRELLAAEKQRQEDHEDLELPTFKQLDLFADKPQEEQDATYWRIEGYKAGLSWQARQLPAGIPPEYHADFLTAFDSGTADLQRSLDATKPEPEQAPDEQPEAPETPPVETPATAPDSSIADPFADSSDEIEPVQ